MTGRRTRVKRLEGVKGRPAPLVFTIISRIVDRDGDGECREVRREVETVEVER